MGPMDSNAVLAEGQIPALIYVLTKLENYEKQLLYARTLLADKANVNVTDDQGRTALMLATIRGFSSLAENMLTMVSEEIFLQKKQKKQKKFFKVFKKFL